MQKEQLTNMPVPVLFLFIVFFQCAPQSPFSSKWSPPVCRFFCSAYLYPVWGTHSHKQATKNDVCLLSRTHFCFRRHELISTLRQPNWWFLSSRQKFLKHVMQSTALSANEYWAAQRCGMGAVVYPYQFHSATPPLFHFVLVQHGIPRNMVLRELHQCGSLPEAAVVQ